MRSFGNRRSIEKNNLYIVVDLHSKRLNVHDRNYDASNRMSHRLRFVYLECMHASMPALARQIYFSVYFCLLRFNGLWFIMFHSIRKRQVRYSVQILAVHRDQSRSRKQEKGQICTSMYLIKKILRPHWVNTVILDKYEVSMCISHV